jgi:hypothetical protein
MAILLMRSGPVMGAGMTGAGMAIFLMRISPIMGTTMGGSGAAVAITWMLLALDAM